MSYWHRFLPPWPVVPPLLWSTLAAAGLAGLNTVFLNEIWSGVGPKRLSGNILLLLTVLTGLQVAHVLWQWPAPAAAPSWWRLLFWLNTRCAAVAISGIAVVMMLLCFG